MHVYYLGDGLLGRTAGLGRARDGPRGPPARLAPPFARAALSRAREPTADAQCPLARLPPLGTVHTSCRDAPGAKMSKNQVKSLSADASEVKQETYSDASATPLYPQAKVA